MKISIFPNRRNCTKPQPVCLWSEAATGDSGNEEITDTQTWVWKKWNQVSCVHSDGVAPTTTQQSRILACLLHVSQQQELVS